MKTRHKIGIIAPLIGIVCVCAVLGAAFVSVKDKEILRKPANLLLVTSQTHDKQIYSAMQEDVKKIHILCSQQHLNVTTEPTLDPGIKIYKAYTGSKRISPYTIQVVTDTYLSNYHHVDVQKQTMYRKTGLEDGTLTLAVQKNDKKEDITEEDLVSYTVEGKGVLKEEDRLEFGVKDQITTMPDYMTYDTFNDLLQQVFHQDIDSYVFPAYANYHVVVSSEEIQKVETLLETNGFVIFNSYEKVQDDDFARFEMMCKIGGGLLVVLLLIEGYAIYAMKKD